MTKDTSLSHGHIHVVNRRPEKPTVHAELALSLAVGFFNDVFINDILGAQTFQGTSECKTNNE